MDISWMNIGEFLKAAVPSIIAGIVAWVAIQNWITAKNKLALDLFDRRYAAWSRLSDLIEKRRGEKEPVLQQPVFLVPFTDVQIALGREIKEARFLFGPEVQAQLLVVEKGLTDTAHWKTAHDFVPPEHDLEGQRRLAETIKTWFFHSQKTTKEISILGQLVEPYMMVNQIAVNRPAEPFTARFRKRKA
ncbi:hypothetical protein [Brevundimonas nasdae]|uniref:Uncharacterized protein n=1 Tax=Brevundimonas nasdae TaxID=172043 RepID=A0ACD4VLR6_9CAUL|nr:hypothetical protein [Brevundimonas nasdae]WOB78463.1 hypothetical protein PZA08_14340 [Brevundimonas nasdae]